MLEPMKDFSFYLAFVLQPTPTPLFWPQGGSGFSYSSYRGTTLVRKHPWAYYRVLREAFPYERGTPVPPQPSPERAHLAREQGSLAHQKTPTPLGPP